MGQRLHIKCNNDSCKCDKEMMFGAGLRSRDSEVIRVSLKEEDAVKWDELLEKDCLEKFMSGYVAGYCSACDELKSVYKVTCVTKDGEEIIIGMECDTCKEPLEEVSLKGKVKCPSCRKGYLQTSVIGLWD